MTTSSGNKGKKTDSKVIEIKPIIIKYYKEALIGLTLGVVLFLSIAFIYNSTVSKKTDEKKMQIVLQESEKELDLHIINSLKFQSLDTPAFFDVVKLVLSQNFQKKNEEMEFVKSIYKTDNFGTYLKLESVIESAKEFKKTNKNNP